MNRQLTPIVRPAKAFATSQPARFERPRRQVIVRCAMVFQNPAIGNANACAAHVIFPMG